MKSLKLFLSIITISLFALTGCDKDNPLDPGGDGGNQGTPTINDFGGAAPVNVLAVVRTSTTQMGFTIDAGVGVASFGNPPQDKGTVKVTSSSKEYTFTKSNDNYYTYTPDMSNPLGIEFSATATPVTFDVSGYSLSQQTVNVPGQLRLTAPATDSSVPRNQSLTVSWNLTGTTTNTAIFIVDKDGKNVFKQNLGNVSSASFTEAEMSTLSAGSAMVFAIAYNFVLTNNNETVLIGQAASVNQITLQ